MSKNLINKYVWLVNTIYQAGYISKKDLDSKWRETDWGAGEEISERTFHKWKNAVEDMFGIIADSDIPKETIRLKVAAGQANYKRSLPLHHSQQEVERTESHSIFELRIRPAYDFQMELLFLAAAAQNAPQTISFIKDSGSWYYVYDQNGKKINTRSAGDVLCRDCNRNEREVNLNYSNNEIIHEYPIAEQTSSLR